MAGDRDIEGARIRQTVLAIPTSIDVGDFAAAERLFASPVRIDYTSLWGGTVQTMSPAELIGGWRALVPGFDATWHELGAIEIVAGETSASARCLVDARHWLDGELWRLRGRYEFDLTRSDRWKVALLRFVLDEEIGDRRLVDRARERAARQSASMAAGAE